MSAKISPRIFISHSSDDNDFVEILAKDLSEYFGDGAVWYDFSGLKGGSEWWDQIVAQLMQCTVFLIVLSPASMNSEWVKDEVAMAWRLKNSLAKIRIVPVYLKPCKVFFHMGNLQFIKFSSRDLYKASFRTLIRVLNTPQERDRYSHLGRPLIPDDWWTIREEVRNPMLRAFLRLPDEIRDWMLDGWVQLRPEVREELCRNLEELFKDQLENRPEEGQQPQGARMDLFKDFQSLRKEFQKREEQLQSALDKARKESMKLKKELEDIKKTVRGIQKLRARQEAKQGKFSSGLGCIVAALIILGIILLIGASSHASSSFTPTPTPTPTPTAVSYTLTWSNKPSSSYSYTCNGQLETAVLGNRFGYIRVTVNNKVKVVAVSAHRAVPPCACMIRSTCSCRSAGIA